VLVTHDATSLTTPPHHHAQGWLDRSPTNGRARHDPRLAGVRNGLARSPPAPPSSPSPERDRRGSPAIAPVDDESRPGEAEPAAFEHGYSVRSLTRAAIPKSWPSKCSVSGLGRRTSVVDDAVTMIRRRVTVYSFRAVLRYDDVVSRAFGHHDRESRSNRRPDTIGAPLAAPSSTRKNWSS